MSQSALEDVYSFSAIFHTFCSSTLPGPRCLFHFAAIQGTSNAAFDGGRVVASRIQPKIKQLFQTSSVQLQCNHMFKLIIFNCVRHSPSSATRKYGLSAKTNNCFVNTFYTSCVHLCTLSAETFSAFALNNCRVGKLNYENILFDTR